MVCHQGRIRGERGGRRLPEQPASMHPIVQPGPSQPLLIRGAGVALDDLVYICTKIARQMDTQGVDRVFEAMESARAAIEDAKPLLTQAVKLSDEVGAWPKHWDGVSSAQAWFCC